MNKWINPYSFKEICYNHGFSSSEEVKVILSIGRGFNGIKLIFSLWLHGNVSHETKIMGFGMPTGILRQDILSYSIVTIMDS